MYRMICKYGIDFGTTNSSIAIKFIDVDNEEHTLVYHVKSNNPQEILPSRVIIGDDGKILLGDDFSNTEKLFVFDNSFKKSHKIIRKVKMELEEKGADYKFIVGNKQYTVIDIIAAILKELRVKAELLRDAIDDDIEIKGVVMGVPVQYGDLEKNVLKKALVQAGYYKDIGEAERYTEFVSEPVAVAVHYGDKMEHDAKCMVFDFGGGTLDVAIMQLNHDDAHQTLAKDRISIGGEEINRLFFTNCICKKYGMNLLNKVLGNGQNFDPDGLWKYIFEKPEYLGFMTRLEECKWELSDKIATKFSYSYQGQELLNKTIYRDEFEDSIDELLYGDDEDRIGIDEFVRNIVEKCISSNRIDSKYDIDYVILAGGSSLIPAVQEILKDEFGSTKVIAKSFANDEMIKKLKHKAIKESEVLTSIVRGLATVGARQGETIVEDIVDCDYGIWDDVQNEFFPIIERGTRCSDTIYDKLSGEGIYQEVECADIRATSVKAQIFQKNLNGESKLGTITIKKPGGKKYKLYMKVDNSKGILEVAFYDRTNHKWMDDIPLDGRTFEIE